MQLLRIYRINGINDTTFGMSKMGGVKGGGSGRLPPAILSVIDQGTHMFKPTTR